MAAEQTQDERAEQDDEVPAGTALEGVTLPDVPAGRSPEARLTEREQYIRFALDNLGARMGDFMEEGDELDETPSRFLQPTLEDLEFQGEIQLGVIIKVWDLELNQSTPDVPALRTFLERRYRYFEDDVEHPVYFEPASSPGDAKTAAAR